MKQKALLILLFYAQISTIYTQFSCDNGESGQKCGNTCCTGEFFCIDFTNSVCKELPLETKFSSVWMVFFIPVFAIIIQWCYTKEKFADEAIPQEEIDVNDQDQLLKKQDQVGTIQSDDDEKFSNQLSQISPLQHRKSYEYPEEEKFQTLMTTENDKPKNANIFDDTSRHLLNTTENSPEKSSFLKRAGSSESNRIIKPIEVEYDDQNLSKFRNPQPIELNDTDM